MMTFSSQFADLSEAYADVKIAAPVVNKMTDPSYQAQVLARLPEQQPSTLASANVKRFLTNTYATQGIVGVKELLDPVIIRDIQVAAMQKHSCKTADVGVDVYLYTLIAALVMLVIVDSR